MTDRTRIRLGAAVLTIGAVLTVTAAAILILIGATR